MTVSSMTGRIGVRAFPEAESKRIAASVAMSAGRVSPWLQSAWSETYRRALATEIVDVFAARGVQLRAWDGDYKLNVQAPEQVIQWLVQQAMANPMGTR